jgi:2-oxoglutarate decarboxylase
MSLDAPAVSGNYVPAEPTDHAGSAAVVATSTPIRGSAAALVRHMESSLTIPTATTMRTFPVRALDLARSTLAGQGRPISASRLIAYAVVRAAHAVPGITHRFEATEAGPERAVDGTVHLGIAVDVPRPDGTRQVMVPVLRDADQLDLAGFVAAYDAIIEAARTGGLKANQLMGANLLLTNTGAFGSTTGVPRLTRGPGAIVAIGTIGYPPGFETVGERLGVSRICTASSTYDHRVVQGADSGLFLKELATSLSDRDSAFWAAIVPGGLPPEPVTDAGITNGAIANGAISNGVVPNGLALNGAAHPTGVATELVVDALRELHRLRREGYRDARLDPLTAAGPPAARGPWPGVTTADVGLPGEPEPFDRVYPRLLEAYCGTLAPDVSHLRDGGERDWWFTRLEQPARPVSTQERLLTLERLVAIDTLERFMQRTYRGHKTLSVQGLDTTVLMTQVLVDLAAAQGATRVNIGMAHRGRVNVLAHVTGMPYARLLAEFERTNREDALIPPGSNGDVKQHVGWESELEVSPGTRVRVAMLPNPSHLEFVSPVALGTTRAQQDRLTSSPASSALAVLMHGDAAFTGQGVVAETFNMHGLAGFGVGGSIHLVQDNQLGFTTESGNLRSTQWPSDIARGYDVPVLHVNADDPDACVRAAELALAFRAEFGRDVVIHVLGYRRLGHTETDEPSFTQSRLYEKIAAHPPVVEQYAAALEASGVIDADTVAMLVEQLDHRLREAQQEAAAETVTVLDVVGDVPAARVSPQGRTAEDLRELAGVLMALPDGLTPHPKVVRVLDRRKELLEVEGLVDWPHAELLAFARIAADGGSVRLSGQDVVRGTFTQRHLTVHDTAGAPDYTPLHSVAELHGRAHAWPSPLSETSVLAFEYGYSLERGDALTIWEAQFGDFANGGQVITDQFISGGFSKWGRRSRLTMLLPHGYDGAGPEHSSARIERFLQLAGENNLTIAVPTTPAQYHGVLVQQALMTAARPLVVFTPKSLLRHKSVVSPIEDLVEARFEPVLVTRSAAADEAVRTVLLCTGKIYYDLLQRCEEQGRDDVALVRLEQLYPFPEAEVRAALARFPAADLSWVQEEPRNMGAAGYVLDRLDRCDETGRAVRYVGREVRAATAEGYGSTHKRVQASLVEAALNFRA